MGYSSWTDSSWTDYTTTVKSKSAHEIFVSRDLHKDMNPKDQLLRESRDSSLHPESNAIIVAVDVTGSMGMIAENLVKDGLGVLFNEILDRKPVNDPQIMVMACGDADYDDSPFQIGQFESDITVTKWLEKIHVEGGGGGNSSESYDLPLYYAAYHTSIDCFEKRNKKGYLFTIGDELPRTLTSKDHIKRIIGDTIQSDLSLEELLETVEKVYNVYHIIITQGDFARRRLDTVKQEWNQYYGQRAIPLSNYKKLSELIVSVIQLNEGDKKDTIIKSWSGDTSVVIADSLSNITDLTKPSTSDSSGVIRL